MKGVLCALQQELVNIVSDHKKRSQKFPPYGKAYFQTVIDCIEEVFQRKLMVMASSKDNRELVQIVRASVDQIILTTDPLS